MERIYPFDFALAGITVEFIAITAAVLYAIGCVARRDAFRFQAADGLFAAFVLWHSGRLILAAPCLNVWTPIQVAGCLCVYFCARNIRAETSLFRLLFLAGIWQAAWGVCQWQGLLPSYHPSFPSTGGFFNPAPASESSFASRRHPPSGLPPMGSMPSAPTPYRDGSSSGRSSPEDFPTPLYAATEPCRRNTCPCRQHGSRHIPAARRPCLPVKTFTPSTNSCGWLSNPGLLDWRSSPAHWSRHSSNPPMPAGHPATQATSCWQSSASDASATPSLPLP